MYLFSDKVKKELSIKSKYSPSKSNCFNKKCLCKVFHVFTKQKT